MGKHDRGAFGALLSEASELDFGKVRFEVDLRKDDDDITKWEAVCRIRLSYFVGQGRTGEEAFRALISKFRMA